MLIPLSDNSSKTSISSYPPPRRTFSPGSFLPTTTQRPRSFLNLCNMALPRTRQRRLVESMASTRRRSSCTQSCPRSMHRPRSSHPKLRCELCTPMSGHQGRRHWPPNAHQRTEHDGEQWDEPRGWAVDFDRANMKLKETTRLGREGAGQGVIMPPCEITQEGEEGQHPDASPEEEDAESHAAEKQEATPSEPQLISRQAPLMLDWHNLYRSRSILEQRWRDPECEPRELRINGHEDRQVF